MGLILGGIIKAEDLTKQVSKVYYIKSYHGYTAKGRFNSELAFKSTTSFVSTFDDKEEPREEAY